MGKDYPILTRLYCMHWGYYGRYKLDGANYVHIEFDTACSMYIDISSYNFYLQYKVEEGCALLFFTHLPYLP